MQYRTLLPQYHLILDALFTAVLLTILGLALSFFIQALVDSFFVPEHQPTSNSLGLGMLPVSLARAGIFAPRSYLSAHLSWRIHAETVNGYHRHTLGLPFTFFLFHRAPR
jgi:ABC-type bacteriocin/lantibiotic exporter with double-glycine peptidase domain